jgi:hypothetical protein
LLLICFPFAAQKSSSCDPCMCIVQSGSIVTKTLLVHTYYFCAGSIIRSFTHNHTIYQVCSHDNQFTCFNPTYCPAEHWLELRSVHLAGNIVTHTQVFDPEKPVYHSGNSVDRLLTRCYYNLLTTTGLVWDEAWERPSASMPGDLTNFQIPAEPPLMMPPLSMKQLDWSAPIIPTKGWNVRSLAFLGQAEGPEASTKTRPPDLWLCVSPCLIVSQLAIQLRNFQLLN